MWTNLTVICSSVAVEFFYTFQSLLTADNHKLYLHKVTEEIHNHTDQRNMPLLKSNPYELINNKITTE